MGMSLAYLQGLKEAGVAGAPKVKGVVGADEVKGGGTTKKELRNRLGMFFLSKRKSRLS